MSNRRRPTFGITRSGLLVPPTSPVPVRKPVVGARVHNVITGAQLLCIHGPCGNAGYDHIRIEVPHEQPQFLGHKRVYIFCSEACRREFAKGTPYEAYL